MSLSATCDAIAGISDSTTHAQVTEIARQSEAHLGHVAEILDAVENTLSTSAGSQRVMLWYLIDRLAKQHALFCEALRPKLIAFCSHYAPPLPSTEGQDFITLLKGSFAVTFGATMISLILLQLGEDEKSPQNHSHSTAAAATVSSSSAAVAANGSGGARRSQRALTVHSNALRSTGAFVTKTIAVERSPALKHQLQVKTLDSQMAMNVASSYAPAKPVEILVPQLRPDADAPAGHMKALPSDYAKNYQETRRKRLRELMEKSREEQDRRQEQELLKRVRQGHYGAEVPAEASPTEGETGHSPDAASAYPDYGDLQMPLEFPRDEHGVKRGNFPLGVRFLRDAIASCGGAVELDVVSTRISTLANREAVAEFGNIREFLLIHSPTFRLQNENGQWIVRLTGQKGSDEATWVSIQCPACSKVVKGRNFARHHNSRQCITAQIALGLQDDAEGRGPIAELAYMAKRIISKRDTCDDGDYDAFADCLGRAAEQQRFRLASTRQFAPIMKAMRVIRDGWLRRKGVEEMDDAVVTASDVSIGNVFRIFGENVRRLPIAWIEMGDAIDMCHRFTTAVRPPFNPPPRPADPRISLQNEYPGFLMCDSELEDEDAPSGDEDEFSDDEAPAFTFAPPVDVAESLFTAGFERDTKRLQHRMRTAPPMVLNGVLKTDRTQTQSEMYAGMQNKRRHGHGHGNGRGGGGHRHRGGGGGRGRH